MLSQVKVKYFTAQAHYYRSAVCEADAKYGQQVAHLTRAEELAKEAVKLAKDLAAYHDSDMSETLVGGWASTATIKTDGRPSAVCTESCKQNLAFITERKNAAVRDNDVVYNEPVPSLAALEPLEKLALAKAMKLTEVFPAMKAIIGDDIFKRLIPMSVHESESVYTSEKDNLMRTENSRVGEADGELVARLASMGLPEALDRIKQVARRGPGDVSAESAEVPKEVIDWANALRSVEMQDPLGHLLQTLDGLREGCRAVLDDAQSKLDHEQGLFEDMKVSGKMWVTVIFVVI